MELLDRKVRLDLRAKSVRKGYRVKEEQPDLKVRLDPRVKKEIQVKLVRKEK